MLFFLLLKKIFVFRKRILSGNVDPDLVVCITIGWMPIKHKYQFVCPVKHNQLVSLVLTRNIVLKNQNFELIMCLYIFDFFFFFNKARKCLLVDGSAICISSRDASYLGQSCWGTCSAVGHRPPGATGVYSSDSLSCYRLGESPAILGGQIHFLKNNVVQWGFNSLLTDKTKQIFKSPPPKKYHLIFYWPIYEIIEITFILK